MSLWNSETGNLIQQETLPAVSTNGGQLRSFKIEGNHLVLLLLLVGEQKYDDNRIVIYELDKVLAGVTSQPREISLGSLYGGFLDQKKMLVDKTSVSVASSNGTVVKLDFWRC